MTSERLVSTTNFIASSTHRKWRKLLQGRDGLGLVERGIFQLRSSKFVIGKRGPFQPFVRRSIRQARFPIAVIRPRCSIFGKPVAE